MTTIVPPLDETNVALFTDLYELTMLQAYFEAGHNEEATFSLFVRRLPEGRNYLLACGLDDVLTYLESLSFSAEAIEFLRSLGQFSDAFLDWLHHFRFTGSVDAVAEGTPVFANEPILEVTAPIAEAQIAETFVMNQIHLQTVLATKAARVVQAAAGRSVVDFGARRIHGVDAANKAARAFHIAGVAGTSNVLAAKLYGMPAVGTMAHSYIQSYDEEIQAFRDFAQIYPETVLLVDSYDTLAGVDKVIALSHELGDAFKIRAVRLDSGDLGDLAVKSRAILDDAGLKDVEIFASSGLDEYKIAELVARGAPIEGFGVGTKMGVSEDAPSLDIAYKLCAYAGTGRVKLSTGKPILPGRKQVFRVMEDGIAVRDVIARADEALEGTPLLAAVMRDGVRLEAGEVALDEIREHANSELDRLPARVRALEPANLLYPVSVSAVLSRYHEEIKETVARPAAADRRQQTKGGSP
jgi:nicotinate phosphoribosyltransferase